MAKRAGSSWTVLGLLLLMTLPVPGAASEESGARARAGGRKPSSADVRPLFFVSQYLRQTPAGRTELTPRLALFYSSLSRSTGSKETRLGHPLGLSAEHGFSPYFALAFHLQWDSVNVSRCSATGTCESAKSAGFFDPNVDLKFRTRLPLGLLAFGANVAYAVEKYRLQNSGEDNNATGGSAITAFAGFEAPFAGGLLGGKFTYDLYKGDRQAEAAGTSYTISGGAALSLAGFYERLEGETVFGGAASVMLVKSRGAYRSDSGETANYSDGYQQLALKGYALYKISPTVFVLPAVQVAYDKFEDGSTFYEARGGADLRLVF